MASIAPRYYVRLKDQNGQQVALFDAWKTLTFSRKINNVYTYTLTFVDNDDARFAHFTLDSQIEIYRSIPGIIPWYLEFEGLHRKIHKETTTKGERFFASTGFGYNDLLQRTVIGYSAGTIRADKENAAETVMKEYVTENCGPSATVGGSVGRFTDGVLPGFTVETDTGQGILWAGSRAYESLLDVLQDIANFSALDFDVVGTGDAEFTFKTFVNQLGTDRTVGNTAGNPPVVFAVNLGIVQNTTYELDRLTEANVVLVLGEGDGSTRTVEPVVDSAAMADSPWNRREISRAASQQEFLYQLQSFGKEVLEEMAAKENFIFVPLQQPSTLYGKHYFFGDKVTIRYGDIERNKRIISVTSTVANSKEQLTFEVLNIP